MTFIAGLIGNCTYTEGEALCLGDTFLAEVLGQYSGQQVNCAFVFGSHPITEDLLLDIAVNTLEGLADAELGASYSEVTGFLWVDENAVIGGHDLLKIFKFHLGQYGAIIIQPDPIDLTESALLLQAAKEETARLASILEEKDREIYRLKRQISGYQTAIKQAVQMLTTESLDRMV